MLDLNVNDLRKKALIRFSEAPDGHVFGVHRLGAGSELELSRLTREANKLILKLDKELNDKELEKIFEKIGDLEDRRLRIKASVFDDGGDGSLSLALARELTDQETARIIEAVEKNESITSEQEADGESTGANS